MTPPARVTQPARRHHRAPAAARSLTRALAPAEHLKAHTGRGGTSNAEAAAAAAAALAARGAAVPPPRAGASRPRPNPPNTELRRAYERSDLPLIVAAGSKHALVWKVPVASLDFHHYLPVFASGLREVEEPYRFIAEAGFDALLAGGGEDKVLPVIPQLIVPLKDALATRDERVVVRTMKAVAALAKLGPRAGAALVPYYRQLLPVASLMGNRALNIGDAMDYGQRRGHVGDTIVAALEALEAAGGPDAYINIKYVVPWYESSC